MSRDKRDAERAARRAQRLAERAEERAKRKERHAEKAAERADRLAERVGRRPAREKDLDQSIEDLVDQVTEKAEAWIDEQTKRLFESPDEEREIKRAEDQARRARQAAEKARDSARRAEKAAEELSEVEASIEEDAVDEQFDAFHDADELSGMSHKQQRKARRRARKRAKQNGYGYSSWRHFDWGYDEWGHSRRRRRPRSAHLYRDRQRKKVCGVCAGTADYFGRPAWEMRLYAVLGLIFIPSITIPAYFIMYFLMDDKPYYRRVTDRFEEGVDRGRRGRDDVKEPPGSKRRSAEKGMENDTRAEFQMNTQMNNVQAMKKAKDKFSDIEQRLRQMESHVTSSRFELQRELKKISGEE